MGLEECICQDLQHGVFDQDCPIHSPERLAWTRWNTLQKRTDAAWVEYTQLRKEALERRKPHE
jgi:hypothetical protein